MRVLIIGCGYVGLPAGAELVRQGHEVYGVRRQGDPDGKLKAAGIHSVQADITKPEALAQLPSGCDWILFLVSSARGEQSSRDIFLTGLRNIVQNLGTHRPKKFVFTSSTSVYGQTDGSPVKETSPTTPATETGQVLVAAEKEVLGVPGLPAVIVRAAGIYGPGRGYLLQQYLKNEARIYGKGERCLNMIHVDDLVGVLLTALKAGRPGEVYNAVDDEPVAEIHFFRWLSETLGKWMPPILPASEMPPRKRGTTHKKVLNRRLKMELGYQFKHPTFRQGYTVEIQRLDRAGELNIEPEPR